MSPSARIRRLSLTLAVGALLAGTLGIQPVRAIGVLFNVTTTDDGIDTNLLDGICQTGGGECSLRAAVMQANAIDPGDGRHRINVPAGTYTLTVGARDEDAAAEGDLDITRDMQIVGDGASSTILQGSATSVGSGLDRAFHISTPNVDLEIRSLTLRRFNPGSDAGGAILAVGGNGSLLLDRVIIANNFSGDDGGAVGIIGSLEIVDSLIRNNESDGATVEQLGGTISILRSTIRFNDSNGGAVRTSDGSDGLIERSTFEGNEQGAPSRGIAVQVGRTSSDGTSMVIRNSTFSGNVGPAPVILVAPGDTLSIRSSTIAENDGAGITASAGTEIKNTILSGNSGGNCEDQAPVSLGHNLDSGSGCGFNASGDISNGDAKLGPLQSNGGSTETMALGSGSDAIDAGAGCPAIDQRGNSRPKDGDSDGTKTCDIGAFEAAKGTTPAPSSAATAPPAPTAAPTEAPTAQPTEEPTAEVTAEPTAEVTAEPTAEPAASAAGPTPEPTLADAPSGSGGLGDATIWIVLGVIGAIIVLGLGFALGRRRQAPPPA